MPPERITVTGATGFVGRALCAALADAGFELRGSVRTELASRSLPYPLTAVGNIGPTTDWRPAVSGSDVVVHLAARAHVMHDSHSDPLAEYRKVNVEGSVRLAQQAAEAGVRRIVFMSSIKVNGESTSDAPFTEASDPAPQDAYGVSKLEAERALQEWCARSGLELAILRPPLIYGCGAKGNLLALMKAVDRGWPLPLGAIHNQRSLIGIDNLIEAVRLCLTHPDAAGATFLVSEEPPVSSAHLAAAIGRALGRPARLLPVPVWALRLAGGILGRSAAVSRLTSSLVVDSSALRQRLGWTPHRSFDDGIAEMVRGYRDHFQAAC